MNEIFNALGLARGRGGIAGVTLLGASAEMCGPALINSLAGETGHKMATAVSLPLRS